MKGKSRAFTLVEVLTAVIVVSIISIVAVSQLRVIEKNAKDEIVMTNLRLIRSAMESNKRKSSDGLYPEGSTSTYSINSNLGLSLPEDGDWDYQTLTFQFWGGNIFLYVFANANDNSRSFWLFPGNDEPCCIAGTQFCSDRYGC